MLIPRAHTEDTQVTRHGIIRTDEYAWMKDAKRPEVRSYLESENAYAEHWMRPHRKLARTLYEEIRARIKEDDMSVPIKDGPYDYYVRTKKGKQYGIHCRREGEKGREIVILDENELARGASYFALGDLEVSEDHRLLAYSTDTRGSEDFTLYIKRLDTGDMLPDSVSSVGDFVWAADNEHIFYAKEEHPHPPRKIYRHRIGSPESDDVLVYEEKDPQWYVALSSTRSGEYLAIYAASYTSTEVRLIPAHEPLREPLLVAPRSPRIRYYVEHHGQYFYITTNERAVNYKIMRTPVQAIDKRHWKTWLPHRLDRSIVSIVPYLSFMLVAVREGGSEELYYHMGTGAPALTHIALPEDAHSLAVATGGEYASQSIRMTYESLVTPKTVFDYHVPTQTFYRRKEQEVPGYDRRAYTSRREWVEHDGVRIPVVIVHKKDTACPAPLLLEAYGSYGISMDPHFSVARLSLLDRGFTYALAHPRGGGEMGWHWHKAAHVLTKHRTAEDFIAVAEHLLRNKYTRADMLAITGGSAGGMLMGQVLNKRPELFACALVYVPAADLISSLSDESIGGTRLHYDEIGNPAVASHYRYIMKHSPYENVRAVAYPSILVRASAHDVRTPFWEAAKWVARLRSQKTDTNPLLFKCELHGGHFGKSGRYEWIKEKAFDFAFLLSNLTAHS